MCQSVLVSPLFDFAILNLDGMVLSDRLWISLPRIPLASRGAWCFTIAGSDFSFVPHFVFSFFWFHLSSVLVFVVVELLYLSVLCSILFLHASAELRTSCCYSKFSPINKINVFIRHVCKTIICASIRGSKFQM
jgi:hypothetical protein